MKFSSLAVRSALMAGLCASGMTAAHAGVVIFDSLGAPAPNVSSLGYEATSTSQWGDRIGFAGTARQLDDVTVRMSTWARASEYSGNPLYSDPTGWSHQLTFNIFSVGAGGAVGNLLGTKTVDAAVPWRPEAAGSQACGDNFRWQAANGICYSGLAFDVTFDFSGLDIVLPDEVIFGLAYNTRGYGANPTGSAGPYNSLNFGLSTNPSAVAVGTNVSLGGAYWDSTYGGRTAGFSASATDYVPLVQFTANVPEPTSLALVGLALAGLGAASSKRRRAS